MTTFPNLTRALRYPRSPVRFHPDSELGRRTAECARLAAQEAEATAQLRACTKQYNDVTSRLTLARSRGSTAVTTLEREQKSLVTAFASSQQGLGRAAARCDSARAALTAARSEYHRTLLRLEELDEQAAVLTRRLEDLAGSPEWYGPPSTKEIR